MKTLSLKQMRNGALCLAAIAFVGYGRNTVRPAVRPAAPLAITTHTLLADGGQETHGKGHLIRTVHPA
jgi:hypothetical protein